MKKTRVKAVSIGAAVALAATGAASCGGDSVSADEYVGSICTAMGDYIDTVVAGQASAQAALSGGTGDPAAAKEEVTSFLDEATTASEDAASEIEDAGTPDVENGEDIADAISSAFDGIAQTFADAQSAAEELPTDSEESFSAAAEEISTDLSESGDQITTGLESVGESSELESAAESNTECQSVQSAALDAPATGTTGATTP
mgnify:CR=1 FL=1